MPRVLWVLYLIINQFGQTKNTMKTVKTKTVLGMFYRGLLVLGLLVLTSLLLIMIKSKAIQRQKGDVNSTKNFKEIEIQRQKEDMNATRNFKEIGIRDGSPENKSIAVVGQEVSRLEVIWSSVNSQLENEDLEELKRRIGVLSEERKVIK